MLMMLKGALAPTIVIAMYVPGVNILMIVADPALDTRAQLYPASPPRSAICPLDLGAFAGSNATGQIREDHFFLTCCPPVFPHPCAALRYFVPLERESITRLPMMGTVVMNVR